MTTGSKSSVCEVLHDAGCHVFPAYALQGLWNNAYLQLRIVLRKCKESELGLDDGITGAEVDAMALVDVEGITEVSIMDDSVSEADRDVLVDKLEVVGPEELSISIGSRGSNSSPREMSSLLSYGLSAAFSVEVVAVFMVGGVATMVRLAVVGGISILGSGSIMVAAGCLGTHRH